MAGGTPMKDAVAAYLALRRTAGFEMANAEYLLDSFARFAAERNETHVHRQTAIDWAAQGVSAGATRRTTENGLSVRPSRPPRR